MFKKIFRKNKKSAAEWYADYIRENGKTGRVYSTYEVDIVERLAIDHGENSILWSVCGGEWFDSFQPLKG